MNALPRAECGPPRLERVVVAALVEGGLGTRAGNAAQNGSKKEVFLKNK